MAYIFKSIAATQFLSNMLFIFFFISRRALAREGDYEMMPVCVCVCAYVR